MPSPTKVQKVRALTERLQTAQAALVSDYRGLTVKDATELRAALREAEATFSIVKNTLSKLAAKEAGFDALADLLEGPTAITFVAGDAVVAAKRLADAARRLPALELKGAVMEGRVLTADQARTLATLESREVVLARMAGLAKASLSQAAYLFQAIQARFLSTLEAYREKLPPREDPGAASAPEPAPVPAGRGGAAADEAEDDRPSESGTEPGAEAPTEEG
jgi:large subunit ribosomal protein L10